MTQTATSIEDLAARLDEAISRVDDLDPAARGIVSEAIETLDELHKQALVAVVRRLRDDPRGKELLFELVDEPCVRMVLAMHGVIRPDPITLARQVLDRIRPGLQSHGGDVELDSIQGTTAFVRLQGACNGCSMASVTMRDSVSEALVAGVPGLTGVDVVPNDPTPTLIPVDSLRVRPTADQSQDEAERLRSAGWLRAVDLRALTARDVVRVEAGPTEAIVLQQDGQVAAYVNKCAHQGRPLDGALLDRSEGTLTCPWHGLCYDATTGECLTLPGAQLQQLPVRVVGGDVWILPGGGA